MEMMKRTLVVQYESSGIVLRFGW